MSDPLRAEPASTTLPRRVILALLLGGLLVLSWAVLRLFLVPLAWAAIIAYATWPIYLRLRQAMGGRPTASALAMTLLLTTALVLPLLWLLLLLRTELADAYTTIAGSLGRGPYRLPDTILAVPWLGESLQAAIERLSADPAALRAQISAWLEQSTGEILTALGTAGRNAAKLGFALVTLFFLYRDGHLLLVQVQAVLRRFIGGRVDAYLVAVGGMTKAVVWGLVATALVQGAVAGVGYWWAGLEAPVLLGAITALVAMIPFGTPFVWGSIAAWLIATGEVGAGIGLLLWGALVVSWIDNLIRPLVISGATRLPFLLVMFGVLGGLAAFGLVGLFIGPVVLAVLVAVWREWLEDTRAPAMPPAPAEPSVVDAAVVGSAVAGGRKSGTGPRDPAAPSDPR